MKRREAIKGLGLSFGALVIGPSALSLLQSCSNEYGPIWKPNFFEQNEVQLLNKITDIILPKTVNSPGATEVNVPQFIDKFINEVFEDDDKIIIKNTMSHISKTLLINNDTENLDAIKPEAIEPMIGKVLTKTKEEENEIWKAYNDAKENNTNVGNDIATYALLNNIRGLSIFAYQNSEFVGEEVLVYNPIPGKQEGCIDISETDGKAYSL